MGDNRKVQTTEKCYVDQDVKLVIAYMWNTWNVLFLFYVILFCVCVIVVVGGGTFNPLNQSVQPRQGAVAKLG